jgi:DNA polymerase III delta' subunit
VRRATARTGFGATATRDAPGRSARSRQGGFLRTTGRAAPLRIDSPDLSACGECQACRWLEAGNHPDFRRVAPEGDDEAEEGASEKVIEKTKKRGASMIKIDQIRELESFVFVGSHRQGNRVVLITEADAMNQPAANSLLKILEEPPSSVYFILASSKAKSLLPTIRSRCRTIPFSTPDAASATAWLARSGLEKQATRYLGLGRWRPDACSTMEGSGAVGVDRRAGGFTGLADGRSDCAGGTLGRLAQGRRLVPHGASGRGRATLAVRPRPGQDGR